MASPNAFIGRTKAPTNAELSAALGAAKRLWDLVVVDMAEELELADHEWKSYGAKHGWAFRLKRGKRNIVHMAPHQGCFTVLFILDEILRCRAAGAPLRGLLGAFGQGFCAELRLFEAP